jgi:protein-disulfide isomerase
MAQEPTITGRCGTITVTWLEEERVDKERIRISRRAQGGEYTPLGGMRIYDREEDDGVRYWFSDSGLDNGVRYEYLISVGDDGESGSSRGPLAISLTCTEKDREILARQKQMIEEYYQKKGVTPHQAQARVSGTSPYQLGSEVHEIDRSDSPHQGDDTLPVTVVVFTDFECIHCAAWAQTLHTIKRTFPSDVSIVFKNYPLSYHKRSEFAAKAALAAWEQGKFWEMHDLLFKNRGALGEKDILGYAENCGLDLLKFQQTLAGERIRKIIARDKLQGKALGVQNVPTSFINGRKLVGAPPVSLVEGMIKELLRGERDR